MTLTLSEVFWIQSPRANSEQWKMLIGYHLIISLQNVFRFWGSGTQTILQPPKFVGHWEALAEQFQRGLPPFSSHMWYHLHQQHLSISKGSTNWELVRSWQYPLGKDMFTLKKNTEAPQRAFITFHPSDSVSNIIKTLNFHFGVLSLHNARLLHYSMYSTLL